MGGQLDRRPGTDRGKGQDLPTWDPGHGPDLFRRIPHGDILEKPWDMSWDYTGRMLSVDGVIRLDFAPFWFMTGLLFEYLTGGKEEILSRDPETEKPIYRQI